MYKTKLENTKEKKSQFLNCNLLSVRFTICHTVSYNTDNAIYRN